MANSELNALTAATAATGGIYYGEQSGNSRKFTVTAAGATLLEAANAAAQRTALGGTTVGQAVLMLTNPSAVTFPRFNADNTVTARSAANFATDLGLGTGDSPQFTALNIGHASDTTLTRVSAGVIAVEGSTILVSGGALGTPSSGTLTSCTGLPVSTGISGLGTGVATALAAGASTGGNGAGDSGKVVTFNSTGAVSFGKSDAAAQVIVTGTGTSLMVHGYGAGNIMDVQSHVAAQVGYSFHCGSTTNTGVSLDFSLSPNGGTGYYVDFGAGHSGAVGVDIGMGGLGIAIRSDAWSVTAIGAVTQAPAAGSTAWTVSNVTHTTSAPIIDAAQTWNAAGVTFTALKLNITNTASAAASLLMDLQVGGTSAFKVDKTGLLSLRSSLDLYNTAIDSTNYEKVTLDWSSNVARLAVRSGGTGTARALTVGAANLPGYGYVHFAANGNVGFGTTGPSTNYEFGATWGCADAVNIVLGSTNGTKIGTATTQKIGFFNATPVVQQTASTALTDNTTGNPGSDLGVCGDTSGSNQASVINNNFATVLTQLNTIRTALTNLGLAA